MECCSHVLLTLGDWFGISRILLCLFHSTAYLNISTEVDTVFNATLLNITGNTYYSTATAVYVPVSYNGTKVACRGQNIANKKQRIIVIGRYDQSCCVKNLYILQSLHHLLLSILPTPPPFPLSPSAG